MTFIFSVSRASLFGTNRDFSPTLGSVCTKCFEMLKACARNWVATLRDHGDLQMRKCFNLKATN